MRTLLLGIGASLTIVTVAAFLGRATLNLRAALTEKPDIGIFLLMKDEGITDATMLRQDDKDTERDYLVQTETGPKLVTLKKQNDHWYVFEEEDLHANSAE